MPDTMHSPAADSARVVKARRKKEKSPQGPTAPPFDSRELAVVFGGVGNTRMPDAECGPAAYAIRPWDHLPRACDLMGVAICQMTSHGRRYFVNDRLESVFIFSRHLAPSFGAQEAAFYGAAAGSYTEAMRTASLVRWIHVCSTADVSYLCAVAAGELRVAHEDNPKLHAGDVMFLIWKDTAEAFEGKSPLEIAEAVRDATFTADEVRQAEECRHAAYEDDDDSEPADSWRK